MLATEGQTRLEPQGSGGWKMRKTTSLKFVCMLGLGLFFTSANAAADGYGPAGCGLGSMIFEPDSGFTQVFAATTNGTSGNQTFGITSGTSNCDPGAAKTASAKAF